MQSRAHTQMPLSYFLADPLTWFLGSLNRPVIKCCFIPGTKPKVYETLQIIIHFFFSPTHSLLIFPGVPLPAGMLSMTDDTFLQVWPRFRLADSAQCFQLSWSSA